MGLVATANALINRQGVTLYLLAVGCLLLGPWNEAAMGDFGLVRGAMRSGEYWRFLTGHLVHANWAHLGLNLAGLVVLQQLFGQGKSSGRLAVGVRSHRCQSGRQPAGLQSFRQCLRVFRHVARAVCLPGVFGIASRCVAGRRCFTAAGCQSGLGQLAGGSSFVERLIDLPVATDAHLYGAAAGVVLGAAMAASGRMQGD